jgi:magnesium transporter
MTSQLIPTAPGPTEDNFRACIFDQTGTAQVEREVAPTGQAPEGGFIWFDITDPSAEQLGQLQARFKLHPLAVEDALHAHQRSKAESYPGFEFVVVHSVSRSAQGPLRVHELNLFIGASFVISVRHGHGFSTQDILDRWTRVPESWRPDPSSLFYVLLDAMVDEYIPFTDALEDELKDLRHALITAQHLDEHVVKHIFMLSELAYASHAAAFPLMDVLTTLLRVGPPVVSENEIPYFRDIRDHAQHVVERLNLAQQMAERAFDIYHSLEARSQAAVSKQLTQVATVFLPLTLMTGFFGQNFGYLVNHVIVSPQAFWILCVGGEVLVALLTVLYVQRLGRK